jgi:hypothetical protein
MARQMLSSAVSASRSAVPGTVAPVGLPQAPKGPVVRVTRGKTTVEEPAGGN